MDDQGQGQTFIASDDTTVEEIRRLHEAEREQLTTLANLPGSFGKVFSDAIDGLDQQKKWDDRFLEIAALVSTWSKDPSTKCGAVIVRPDRTIVSTGYNGFPRGCDDAEEFYEDRELKLARVVHAELNALLHARESLVGYTLYTHPPGWGPSCDRCTAHIIQAGITRVVHRRDESEFASRWKEPAERGLTMYREAGVEVVHA